MGKSKNGSSWGTFMKFFLQVGFCISLNSKLGPLKKMMPPLFKKKLFKQIAVVEPMNCDGDIPITLQDSRTAPVTIDQMVKSSYDDAIDLSSNTSGYLSGNQTSQMELSEDDDHTIFQPAAIDSLEKPSDTIEVDNSPSDFASSATQNPILVTNEQILNAPNTERAVSIYCASNLNSGSILYFSNLDHSIFKFIHVYPFIKIFQMIFIL